MLAKLSFFLFLGFLLSGTGLAADNSLRVAVAANFAPTLEKVSSLYTRETGVVVQLTISSSGRFYAQIRNGAPFDLFFSADRKRPDLLFQDGYCEEPLEYAQGRVVLWSRRPSFCGTMESWQDALREGGLKKIGMANPELAPYGAVAREMLVEEKLWSLVEERLVYGANVGQCFQYAASGAADASFIPLSLALSDRGKDGCFFPLAEASPVVQKSCVLLSSTKRKAAEDFLAFIVSDRIQSILEQYGYGE